MLRVGILEVWVMIKEEGIVTLIPRVESDASYKLRCFIIVYSNIDLEYQHKLS
jgi:hypothetical protein